MEDERENEKQPEDRMLRESVRVQKTLYLQEQLAKRHQEETRLLEQLLEEQRVIDGLQGSLEENMERTAETRHYNRELKESMEQQVYALHGISEDLLKGMREYKNAYYRGCAAALFFLSAGLTLLCGRLHGFGEGITLLMLAGTALEGALLAQERKRILFLDVLCRLLYLLLFPMMLVLFVFYELGYAQYGRFLPYVSMGALLLTVAGTFSYFAYNPYRKAGRRARSARGQIGEIEKIAGREARKSRRLREKEEKRFRIRVGKEEEAALRLERKQEAAAARRERWQEWKGRLARRIKRQAEKPEQRTKGEAEAAEAAPAARVISAKEDASFTEEAAVCAEETSLPFDGITENI